MSHFIGLVFHDEGTDYNALLAPYDEQTNDTELLKFDDQTEDVVASYAARKDTMTVRERMEYNTLHKYATEYFRMKCITDEQGNNRYGYYYNPNAKWDWYSEGGRWDGFIKTLDKTAPMPINSAPFEAIDWDTMLKDENIPFCIVTAGGEWRERGNMGWWAMVADEKPQDAWHSEVRNYVQTIRNEGYADRVRVEAIDFHI